MTALVIGVDEAGRGCLAGPVFAAAVVWSDVQLAHANKDFPLIRDSKKLSSKQRQEAHDYIIEHAAAYAVAYADANAVDDMGVMGATMSAMHEAINEVSTVDLARQGGRQRVLALAGRDPRVHSQGRRQGAEHRCCKHPCQGDA